MKLIISIFSKVVFQCTSLDLTVKLILSKFGKVVFQCNSVACNHVVHVLARVSVVEL